MVICPICCKRSKLFCQKYKYLYYRCFHCSTLFLYPKLSSNKLTAYYQKSFHYSAGLTNKGHIKQRAGIIINNLKRFYPQGKTLLDIGSGYGFFLEEARKYKLQPLGIEPSKHLFKYSNNRNKIRVENITFESFYKKNRNKRFDFITLIHVIEHVRNPQNWLNTAISLLNKDGILFIETPNLNSHLFNFEKENYTFLISPEHLWIFSQKLFQTMIKNIQKLEIIKTSTNSYPEHMMGIIKKNFQSLICHPEHAMPAGRLVSGSDSNQIPNQVRNDKKNPISDFKYLLFDQILAPILTPLLNIDHKGSILELYIRKIN